MASDPSFDDWMNRLKAGDDEAALRVFELFNQRLIALARSRLDVRIRQRIDPDDVLQSVWKSFFHRQATGLFDVKDWDGLWAILTGITIHKCWRCWEHHRAGVRDVTAEVSSWEFLDREPTPPETALLTETLELVMRGLKERQRTVVRMILQGYTVAEISAEVEQTPRTVQRVLKEVRRRLEHQRSVV